MKKTETFSSLIQELGYRHNTRAVFDDFLTLTIATFGRNYSTGLSYDEDLYLKTIAKYQNKGESDLFPKLLGLLIIEMENRLNDSAGNDVLGDFYELHLSENGKSQFFTPWPICQFMAKTTVSEKKSDEPMRVLDPACGSGRTLLAAAKEIGSGHHYYGIDIDETCVKMAVVNLFLNGVFKTEIMCANALDSDDFRVSYKTSFLPLGIYRITEKEKSELWHIHRNSFDKEPVNQEENKKASGQQQGQLKLF